MQNWFSALNPYGETKSVLQLEKVNYAYRAPIIDAGRKCPPRVSLFLQSDMFCSIAVLTVATHYS